VNGADQERKLQALALVRAAAEDRDMAEIANTLEVFMEDKGADDLIQFLWDLAQLGGALVNGWYESLIAFGVEPEDLGGKPTTVLDLILAQLITEELDPDEEDEGEDHDDE
jgi:hypothetical protein